MRAGAGAVGIGLRHHGRFPAEFARDLLHHHAPDDEAIRHGHDVGIGKVELELAVGVLVVEGMHLPAERVHRRDDLVQELEIYQREARVIGRLGNRVAGIVRRNAVMRRGVAPDDVGFALDAEIELQTHLGGALDLPGEDRARAHRIRLFVIGQLAGDHGDVRPPRELHHGIRVGDHGELVVVRALAETVEGGAGKELGAAHHPVEMSDRHRLRLGDPVGVDIKGHAILDPLVDETLHRLPLLSRVSFLLRSGRSFVHGRLLSFKDAAHGKGQLVSCNC